MALIKCPECNTEVSDKADHCPRCAYPIKNKFEPNINEYTKTDDSQNKEPVGNIENTQSDGVASISNKKRLVSFLLCTFLGFLGIHHFYVGNKKKFYIYLALFLLIFINGQLTGIFAVSALAGLALFVLNIIDWFKILFGKFKDGRKRLVLQWVSVNKELDSDDPEKHGESYPEKSIKDKFIVFRDKSIDIYKKQKKIINIVGISIVSGILVVLLFNLVSSYLDKRNVDNLIGKLKKDSFNKKELDDMAQLKELARNVDRLFFEGNEYEKYQDIKKQKVAAFALRGLVGSLDSSKFDFPKLYNLLLTHSFAKLEFSDNMIHFRGMCAMSAMDWSWAIKNWKQINFTMLPDDKYKTMINKCTAVKSEKLSFSLETVKRDLVPKLDKVLGKKYTDMMKLFKNRIKVLILMVEFKEVFNKMQELIKNNSFGSAERVLLSIEEKYSRVDLKNNKEFVKSKTELSDKLFSNYQSQGLSQMNSSSWISAIDSFENALKYTPLDSSKIRKVKASLVKCKLEQAKVYYKEAIDHYDNNINKGSSYYPNIIAQFKKVNEYYGGNYKYSNWYIAQVRKVERSRKWLGAKRGIGFSKAYSRCRGRWGINFSYLSCSWQVKDAVFYDGYYWDGECDVTLDFGFLGKRVKDGISMEVECAGKSFKNGLCQTHWQVTKGHNC